VHAFSMRGHGSHSHEDNVDAGRADHEHTATASTSERNPNVQQPVANAGATKGEHKHGCC